MVRLQLLLSVALLAGCPAADVCRQDSDCVAPHVCVQGVCGNPAESFDSGPILDLDGGLDAGVDAGCALNADCSGTTPVCDTATGACTGCLPDGGPCPPGQYCAPADAEYACVSGCATAADCPTAPAGAMAVCNSHECSVMCTSPQAMMCGGACVDTTSDPMNCGACGNHCAQGEVCSGSKCVCPGGQKMCDGTCIDTSSDVSNCGSCGNHCPAGALCMSGSCVCQGAGEQLCGHTCVNTTSDSMNCGSCGQTCDQGSQTCQSGHCACSNPTWTNCGAYCANTVSDEANCGACRNACPAPDVCSNSTCADPCTLQGLTDCDGSGTTCLDTTSDPNNCGGCYLQCQGLPNAGTPYCKGSQCYVNCNPGFLVCSDMCVDLTSDPNNCGSCGHQCAAGESCCNSTCSDTQSDRHNCGSCGNGCPVYDTGCSSGQCCVLGAFGVCL